MSPRSRRLSVVVVVSLFAAPVLADAGHKAPFGPWDAGDERAVKRQGRDGLARRQHPAVGDAAKVPASGPPPPSLRRDDDVPETALEAPNRAGASLSSNPLYLAALVYSSFLTKVDGPRCQHLPTCSRFASQAVARHGAVGFLMGLERLIQDDFSSSIRRLPEVEYGDAVRLFDPLENYEFWRPGAMSGLAPAVPEEPLELLPLDEARDAALPAAGSPKAGSPEVQSASGDPRP